MFKIFLLINFIFISLVAFGQVEEPPFLKNFKISIKPLKNINSATSDISPVIKENKLLYSSVPVENFVEWRLKRNIAYYETYNAGLIPGINDVTIPVKIIDGDKNYNVGPVSWCNATKELFVTISNAIDLESVSKLSLKVESRLRIVIMKEKEGKWQIVEDLPFNDSKYNFGHPAINTTGDTLIFVSDVETDNIGETDLYMSVRKDGLWSYPLNLGENINTKGQEMFPSFLPGGLLSFSSNGRKLSFGNLDIYFTAFPKINQIKNMGSRINSQHDDFGLVVEPNLNFAFFASNRPGKGSDDIFRIEIEKGNLAQRKDAVTEIATVPETMSEQVFSPNIRMGTKKTEPDAKEPESMELAKPDKPDSSMAVQPESKNDKKDVKVIDISEIETENAVEQKDDHPLSMIFKNIYYDFARWNITPEAGVILDELAEIMKMNDGLKILLSSHADSRGSAEFNLLLTEKRSNSALDYVSNQGISENRFKVKNFGENNPVNHCVNGVLCSEADHALNRRTEFKVLQDSEFNTMDNNIQNFTIPDKGIVYSIQILALSQKNEKLPQNIHNDEKVVQKQIGTLLKFFYGQYDSYEKAKTEKNKLKNVFKDAFIVAFKDGMLVQIKDLPKK